MIFNDDKGYHSKMEVENGIRESNGHFHSPGTLNYDEDSPNISDLFLHEKDELHSRIDELEKMLETVTIERNCLKSCRDELLNQVEEAKSSIKELSICVERLESQVGEKSQKLEESFRVGLVEKEEKINMLEEELDEVKKENSHLQHSIEDMEENNQKNTLQINELEEIRAQLTKQLREKSIEMESLEQKLFNFESLTEKLQLKEDEQSKVKDEVETSSRAFKVKISEKELIIAELNDVIKAKDEILEDKEREIQVVRRWYHNDKKSERDIETEMKQLVSRIDKVTEINNLLEKRINLLTQQSEEDRKCILILKAKSESYKAKVKDGKHMQRRNMKLQDELNSLNSQLNEFHKREVAFEKQIRSMQEIVQLKNTLIDKYHDEFSEVAETKDVDSD